MRTIETRVYTFDELPKEVQTKIIESWDKEFWPHDEFIASVKRIAEFLDVEVTTWSYDHSSYSHYMRFKNENAERKAYRVLRGKLTARELERTQYGMKSYYKRYPKIRKSRITWDLDNCVFTGVCYDLDFADTIKELYTAKNFYEWDFRHFCRTLFNKMFRGIMQEYRYHCSAEGVAEEIKARELEFYIDGQVYRN